MYFLNKIRTKNEAFQIINILIILMVFITSLELLPLFLGDTINYFRIIIQLFLIIILRVYYSRSASILLFIDIIIVLFIRSMRAYYYGFSVIDFVMPFIILLLCIRAIEATIKIHGYPSFSPKSFTNLLKIYLVFFLFVSMLYMAYTIFYGVRDIYEYIYIPIILLTLTGLYGLIYKKGLICNQFWKLFFVLVVFWDISYNLYYYYNYKPMDLELSGMIIIVFLIVFITCNLPSYVILYVYGYKSKQLWRGNEIE